MAFRDLDELTGIMNRKAFERELLRVIRTAAENRCNHTLIMLDIDQFSMVNDVCGFEGGDHLLQKCTHTINNYMNTGTLMERTGDDEFSILLEYSSLDRGFQLAEALRRAMENAKFSWKNMSVPVTTSVGIVTVDERCVSPAALLSNAFTACRLAKEAGKNCSRLYQPLGREFEQRQRLIKSVPIIEQALQKNLMHLHAQMITPLFGGEAGDHYEILLRVKNEDGDLECPEDFIRAAEQYDRMRSIDRRVVNAFFSWAGENRSRLEDIGGFTLNLSGQSLLDETFGWFLKEKIDQSPIPPQLIGFEVTETALIRSTSRAHGFIQNIRDIGCKFVNNRPTHVYSHC